MSYDIYVGCPHCSHVTHSSNITWNVGPYFRWALGDDGLHQLNGLTVEKAGLLLHAALDKPCEDLAKFDADNGWGTGADARQFLEVLLNACQASSSASVVRLST